MWKPRRIGKSGSACTIAPLGAHVSTYNSAQKRAGVAWANRNIVAPPMSSQRLTTFFIGAAPLTFALLWSSGFIVAKYAAPDADPFTFLTVRCGSTIVVLALIIVASRAPPSQFSSQVGDSVGFDGRLRGRVGVSLVWRPRPSPIVGDHRTCRPRRWSCRSPRSGGGC